ncbi:MAG: hypothetical protein SNG27_02035 [Rikenellaceae bacterium]
MRNLKFILVLIVSAFATSAYSADKAWGDDPYPVIDPATGGIALPQRSSEPIYVTTLEEMQKYLKKDNVHVILKKGEFRVTAKDIDRGKYPATTEVVEGRVSNALFLVKGNGSTYDFGGSTIITEIKGVFNSSFLSGELSSLHILGNGNVVTGVTFIDEGGIHDFPPKGCTNIIVDGRNNIVDNIELRSIGSMPYAYGDTFGKGKGTLVKLKKHCGVLVRGDDNTFQNSKVVHHAYGHCVFMQGAVRPNIINNYITSEMSTTLAILAEKGDPNSKANSLNFLTAWGFHMDEEFDYTKALCEAGIRAYINGNTMIDGVRYRRGSVDGSYIKGNYVKDTRVGVTLTHSNNKSRRTLVEDCTTLGTERGYAVNDDAVVRNCFSDAKYGPAYGVDYARGKNNVIEITIIDAVSADYVTSHYDGKQYRTNNAQAHIAYIQGTGHKIKFRDGRVNDKNKVIYTNCPDKNITFCAFDLGGDIRVNSQMWKPTKDGANPPHTLNDEMCSLVDTYIANQTTLPIRVDENAKGNYIWSVGEVFEEVAGTNKVVKGNDWDIDKVFTF